MKRLSICLVALAFSRGVALDAVTSAPGNLVTAVTGSTVTLSWTAPPGALLGYRVEAGTAPSLSNITSVVIGMTTTFSAPNVPAGTYYVRVRAIATDGESPPSNEVVVVVGGAAGCATAPQPPTNLVPTLNGTTVTLAWVSGGGCAATNYVIEAGSAPGLADLAVVNAGNVLSFSATAPPGSYYVRVIAQTAFGRSGPSNQINLVVGGTTTPLGNLSGTLNALATRMIVVTMPTSGRYQATLTWSDSGIDLDLYLASTDCVLYPPLPCLLSVSSETVGNSEQVSWLVRAGERYALWVDSWSDRASSYFIQQIIMTPDEQSLQHDDGNVMMPPSITKWRAIPR